jgi:hypothetical protein
MPVILARHTKPADTVAPAAEIERTPLVPYNRSAQDHARTKRGSTKKFAGRHTSTALGNKPSNDKNGAFAAGYHDSGLIGSKNGSRTGIGIGIREKNVVGIYHGNIFQHQSLRYSFSRLAQKC